jgi:hypothetical protein
MSSPNGSLANLLVTRKSLDASDTRTPLARNLRRPFPVPFAERMTGEWGEIKRPALKGAGMSRIKAGAESAPDGLETKSRRRTGAGNGNSRRQSRRDDRLTRYFWMLE